MRTVTQVPEVDQQLELPLGDFVVPDYPEGASLQAQFDAFNAANRWIFWALVMLTEDWLAKGHRRVSIDMLVHILRWQHGRQTTGSHFKINNNTTSRYARALIEHRPECAAVFQLRELRTP